MFVWMHVCVITQKKVPGTKEKEFHLLSESELNYPARTRPRCKNQPGSRLGALFPSSHFPSRISPPPFHKSLRITAVQHGKQRAAKKIKQFIKGIPEEGGWDQGSNISTSRRRHTPGELKPIESMRCYCSYCSSRASAVPPPKQKATHFVARSQSKIPHVIMYRKYSSKYLHHTPPTC